MRTPVPSRSRFLFLAPPHLIEFDRQGMAYFMELLPFFLSQIGKVQQQHYSIPYSSIPY